MTEVLHKKVYRKHGNGNNDAPIYISTSSLDFNLAANISTEAKKLTKGPYIVM